MYIMLSKPFTALTLQEGTELEVPFNGMQTSPHNTYQELAQS